MKAAIFLVGAVAPAFVSCMRPEAQSPLIAMEVEDLSFTELTPRALAKVGMLRGAGKQVLRGPPIPPSRRVLDTQVTRETGARVPRPALAVPPTSSPLSPGGILDALSSPQALSRSARAREAGFANMPNREDEHPGILLNYARLTPSAPIGSISDAETEPSTPAATPGRATSGQVTEKGGAQFPAGGPGELPKPLMEQKPELAALLQEIIGFTKLNTEARREMLMASDSRGRLMQDVLKAAMHEMSPGVSLGQIVIHNVKDPVTGAIILDKCVLEQGKLLGSGASASVYEMKVIGEKEQTLLGATKLALKVMHSDFYSANPQPAHLESAEASYKLAIQHELSPVQAAAEGSAMGDGGMTAREVARRNRWGVPLFEGTLGTPETPIHLHGTYGFYNKVLFSEVARGDALVFVQNQALSVPEAHLSIMSRELVCRQMVQSVANLHKVGLVHMDIKPQNFLIGMDGTVSLTDFGMSGRPGETRDCRSVGTPAFFDPRLAGCFLRNTRLKLDVKYDSWPLGMTCYGILMSGRRPYGIDFGRNILERLRALDLTNKSNSDHLTARQTVETELRDRGVSKPLAAMVSSLLDLDRHARPSVQEVLEQYPMSPLDSNED